MVNFESFTVPDRLYLLRDGREPRVIKSLPARFDASAFVTEQAFATSADGERIPYFVVRPEDLPFDGTAPTLLYGYGGFEVSLTPSYASPGTIAWLKQGGVYVLANIRGGGEFGPRWHEAALLENRDGMVAPDDGGWNATAYLWHLTDLARSWAERWVQISETPGSRLVGWDPDELAEVRGYRSLPTSAGVWALRSAVETFVEVTAMVALDTPFEHGDWGTGDVADGLRWLGHEFHHHETDVVARAE